MPVSTKDTFPDSLNPKSSDVADTKKPLMSILVHTPPLHSRQTSRSSADFRPLTAKEGASPPPASPVRTDLNRGHILTLSQSAQPSSINILPASSSSATASNRSHRRNATSTTLADMESDSSGDLEAGFQAASSSFVVGGYAFHFS